MSHLFVSAAHKSSGKTTISIGLCAALAARGSQVQPFKKGPDYIDPMWLSRAAGRACYNLDFYTMADAEIATVFAQAMVDADVGIIEGNKGLYDGLDLDGSNSNAALARSLRAPVILVIDARGMTRGIAPLILGYQAFEPDTNIAGVILNQLGGPRHEAKLRAVIEHYTDVPVVGAVAAAPELEIVERHLGLMPSNESTAADGKVREIGQLVGAQVDLDALCELADTAGQFSAQPPVPVAPVVSEPVRIGIARDDAFGFYYPHDLEALEAAGARLVPVNTLADSHLPALDGLFIGGGFPEARMAALEDNVSLRQDIRRAIENGLATYAECGGLMYLARSLAWGDQRAEMVGVIPGDVVMHKKPQGRGYVRLQETDNHPWESLSAGPGMELAAHEFHYSSLENLQDGLQYAYRVKRGHGVDGIHDGIVIHNLLASYVHLRDVGANHWARRFVAYVAHCRDRNE